MTALNKQALRQLATDAHELGIIKRYTKGIEANKRFVAIATPLTVLALLDELEAKDKSISFLKDQLAQLANFNPDWDKLEAATYSLREHMAELTAARKRIAELEALDKPKFVQCWSCKHDIEVLAIADCDGYCPRCAAPIDLDDEPYAAAGKGE
ncbi:TPA: ead/Ea22-like family protein [Enterobacter kobei]